MAICTVEFPKIAFASGSLAKELQGGQIEGGSEFLFPEPLKGAGSKLQQSIAEFH